MNKKVGYLGIEEYYSQQEYNEEILELKSQCNKGEITSRIGRIFHRHLTNRTRYAYDVYVETRYKYGMRNKLVIMPALNTCLSCGEVYLKYGKDDRDSYV